MQNKILTPIQLWQDFNPVKDLLKLSVLDSKKINNVICTDYAFNALTVSDGSVRVFAKVYKQEGLTNMPVLLHIKDYTSLIDDDIIFNFINKGFAVVTFDYSGKTNNKENYTKYPPSLNYGNYLCSGDKLFYALNGVANTSLHLWVKVARRVLTFISALPGLDSERICGMAWGYGANILWQLAGIDGRLKAIVPIFNCGWSEYKGYDKYSDNSEPPFNDERTLWNIGSAVTSYVKFIAASILFIGATNNDSFSYDRLSDTMKLLPESTKHLEVMCVGAQNQIYSDVIEGSITWLEYSLSDNNSIKEPYLSLNVVDDKLEAVVNCDTEYDDISEVVLYTAYKETSPFLRSWNPSFVAGVTSGVGKTIIKIYDYTDRLFTFANIKYKNGLTLSTPLVTFNAEDYPNVKLSIRNSRIIFERKMGLSMFFVKTEGFKCDRSSIILANGPLDICGIGSTKGSLICYNIGDVKNLDNEVMLQLDAFCATQKEITLMLTDSSKHNYTSKITICNGEEWTKIRLSSTEFKDIELLPLKSWENVKFITFNNIDNVLLNNILWV